jgi:hypothetical protein
VLLIPVLVRDVVSSMACGNVEVHTDNLAVEHLTVKTPLDSCCEKWVVPLVLGL